MENRFENAFDRKNLFLIEKVLEFFLLVFPI